jgi:uroporphyrin-III C-methyltransferase
MTAPDERRTKEGGETGSSDRRAKSIGQVTLVGAGPGDPELITVRGLKALQQADIVLYDRLVGADILEFARPGAELVSVGKRCGCHSVPQERINELLIEHARAGKRVVRLKNGDPFIFGRGGEEADALAAADVPFEVIPGVTAASAAGACCVLPLTRRGVSSCVTLVTGHEDPTKGRSDVDWAALARLDHTLVIYMAMAHLELVVSKLISSGLSPATPAAVISQASLPQQTTLAATLEELPARVRERGLAPPSIVVIGPVAECGSAF